MGRSRLSAALLWAIKIGLLVYLGLGVVLYVAQRALMYPPVAENAAEDVPVEWLAIDGGRLKLWVLSPQQPHAVIYFGGNAEDVYWNVEDFRRALPGHAVYLVNYRGYGGSSGSPSEAALFADALRLFDSLRERHARVSVIGRSLGSGVATYLASRRPVERLVLATPYDSTLAVARASYPIYPVGLLLKDRYESVRYAAEVPSPALLLVAENDTLIPREHSNRLARSFDPAQVRLVVVEGAGHNDIAAYPRYWQAIADFLHP